MPVAGVPNAFIQYPVNLTEAQCASLDAVVGVLRTYRKGALEERRNINEEGSRAALVGLKNQAVAGELLTGLPASASSLLFCAPVLELADRRGLQPRAIPGFRVRSPAGALY
jgi:hypothetical protein